VLRGGGNGKSTEALVSVSRGGLKVIWEQKQKKALREGRHKKKKGYQKGEGKEGSVPSTWLNSKNDHAHRAKKKVTKGKLNG